MGGSRQGREKVRCFPVVGRKGGLKQGREGVRGFPGVGENGFREGLLGRIRLQIGRMGALHFLSSCPSGGGSGGSKAWSRPPLC